MSSDSFGIEGLAEDDRRYSGSRFAEVRDAVFANPYPRPYERFELTLGSLLRGLLPFGKPWPFLAAARRTVASHAVLRWGPDGKGYRRLLHPNGICLTGKWEITAETPYSGYFRNGSRGLVVARYSTCCSETRRGYTRSLAIVGRIWPTTDPEHPQPLPSASFITQEDIGGADTPNINKALLRNAPDITPARRGGVSGLLSFMATGLVLTLTDKQVGMRQVYEIAELGKPDGEPTRSPEFMQFTVSPEQPVIPGDDLDFRDEIMAQVYDTPQRSLTFRIETSDTGTIHAGLNQRSEITGWRQIGTMTFDAAAASYNGDHVIHVHHPPWREDRNDPATLARKHRAG